jgi:glycosyltransferase involved in cell wall biosynthesis
MNRNMSPLKVFFQSIGVLTTYNLDLTKALSKLGVNVYVDAECSLARLMLLRAKLFTDYDPHLRFLAIIHKLIPKEHLKKLIKRFDVLHINSLSDFSSKVIKLSDKPKVFVLHSAPLAKETYEEIKDHIDAFIAPSEFTAKEESSKLGFKPIVIHHGVDTVLFNTSILRPVARKRLNIPTKTKVVLWNDRVSPEKDLETFLRAIQLIEREVSNVYFYIKMRAVNKNYFRGIRDLLENVKRKSNVRIHIGWIMHEELPFLYRSADVFVRTSLYENFGLGFVEAMACGTPVVAPNIPIASEVLNGIGLLFNLRDPEDLAHKVITLLNHDGLREELSRASVERVEKNFTWETAAKKYLSIYESLV